LLMFLKIFIVYLDRYFMSKSEFLTWTIIIACILVIVIKRLG